MQVFLVSIRLSVPYPRRMRDNRLTHLARLIAKAGTPNFFFFTLRAAGCGRNRTLTTAVRLMMNRTDQSEVAITPPRRSCCWMPNVASSVSSQKRSDLSRALLDGKVPNSLSFRILRFKIVDVVLVLEFRVTKSDRIGHRSRETSLLDNGGPESDGKQNLLGAIHGTQSFHLSVG